LTLILIFRYLQKVLLGGYIPDQKQDTGMPNFGCNYLHFSRTLVLSSYYTCFPVFTRAYIVFYVANHHNTHEGILDFYLSKAEYTWIYSLIFGRVRLLHLLSNKIKWYLCPFNKDQMSLTWNLTEFFYFFLVTKSQKANQRWRVWW